MIYKRELKNEDLSENLNRKTFEDIEGNRLIVAVSMTKPKLYAERTFKNTVTGRDEMKEFYDLIKNETDLKKYLGVIK